MHLALHEVQKQFKCDLCEKSFVTKRSLQEHMSIHTGKWWERESFSFVWLFYAAEL